MKTIRTTSEFSNWLSGLKDQGAKDRIAMRLDRVKRGLFGDAKFFDGIGELRIDCGPGYRLYFAQRGNDIVILLCGGSKKTQKSDIERARAMNAETD
jgi:putative addiction module killer protein